MKSFDLYDESQIEIEEHLTRFATTYAYSKGYKFGPGVKNAIEGLAIKSTENIINPKREYVNVPVNLLIGIVEKSLGIFIDHMIMARPKVYSDLQAEDNMLDERTFEWARNLLCPMWPFCP